MNAMNFDKLKCPRCGALIPISETIAHQIAENTREEMKAESVQKNVEIAKIEKGLKAKELALDQTIEERLKGERATIEKQAIKKANDQTLVELENLRREGAERQKTIDQVRKVELDLRAEKRALEEREKQRDIEIARTLDQERRTIQEAAALQAEEGHRLKDAEKDKKFQDVIKANEELTRKLQQGSQQTQGEVLELDIELAVKAAFPIDQIEPVPKGIGGADILQRVVSKAGNVCGIII
jgi:hypothetical protein